MDLPIITRMRKQCVPGALSPPPPRLGTRLGEEGKRVGKGKGKESKDRHSKKGEGGGVCNEI